MERAGCILVADDDAPFRISLLKFLENEGYACTGVADAEGTMEALRRNEFELLVADIGMPGNAQLELIRELPVLAPGLPVILLTGSPSVETAASSVRLSVGAYLVKPPNLIELRALIREAITNHLIFREVRSQWKQFETVSIEATQELGTDAREPEGAGEKGAQQSLVLALKELLRAGVGKDTAAMHQLARHAELVRALQETIAVLKRTKHAFKSKQLGALRHQLEKLFCHPKSEPRV